MESMWLLTLFNLVFGFLAATLKTFIGFVVIYQFYGCYLILRYPDGITRWEKTGIKYFPPIK